MAKAQPEARERELAAKLKLTEEQRIRYNEVARKRKQKRNNQWTKLVETGITKIVGKHAYRGRNEVNRQIKKYMNEIDLESSDVDSVVNCARARAHKHTHERTHTHQVFIEEENRTPDTAPS